MRTGVNSNDHNGVLSTAGAVVPASLVADLLSWFGTTPACWLTTGADRRLGDILIAAGARPERSGSWSGGVLPMPPHPVRAGIEVVRVRDEAQLDSWLELAERCGWIEDVEDRRARRRLFGEVGLSHPALSHWLAVDRGQPVGFASLHLDGGVVDLVDLAVLESHRRRGIGSTLVQARLADAMERGATAVVSAPSPDGWLLQRALGFVSVPVRPDRCFYLPG